MKITKAVIPAAGLGTRFLPYTKSIPKEMLPLVDKPAIHYIVEECAQSHIEQVALIINKDKSAITRYFTHIDIPGQEKRLQSVNTLIDSIDCVYLDQAEPLGLGHAVYQAKDFIGNSFFGVLLPDDLIAGTNPELANLIAHAQKLQATVIAIQEINNDTIAAYGVIDPREEIEPDVWRIADLVEKPHPANAPSRYAIIGRYVFSPRIFEALENITPRAGNDLQLTDAIRYLITDLNEPVYACRIQGARYDLGYPAGWLKAAIDLASKEVVFPS